ncbi:60S ribosomal export protein NMD3 [Bienertia sinuspersici]
MKESRKSSYKNPNIFSAALAKRASKSMESRRLRRENFLVRKRSLEDSNCAAFKQKSQMTNTHLGPFEELGFVSMRSQTIGHIPCCKCSIPILPNAANMCTKCLNGEIHIDDLPSRVKIERCQNCVSYLKPPKTWVRADNDSKELLSFCLGKIKKLLPEEIRLIDATIMNTDPNSKRIKVKIRVQRKVQDHHGVIVETSKEIEYFVVHRLCPSCSMPAMNQDDNWNAVVQVRQYVPEMRTLNYLEGVIHKHRAFYSAVKLKQVQQGVDFFFAKKSDAMKFLDFVSSVALVQPQSRRFHNQLVSQDLKSNTCRHKYNIVAVISPICRDDLIYLSPKLSARFGQIGPLVICTKVRNKITLLNPFTLKFCIVGGDQYWREPFEAILSVKQLVEYIVLDAVIVCSEEVDSGCQRYVLADVEIARVSDFGKNDRIISVRTHLGHLLKPGDHVLGYDLYGANFNCSEAEEHKASFPDVVLIQKTFLKKKLQGKSSKASCSDSDYNNKQMILRDLERLSLYGSVEDEVSHGMDSIVADAVLYGGLADGIADLNLSDGDPDSDGCITDAEG